MQTIKINILGMTCDACVKLSKLKISKISGVREVKIGDINGKTEIIADRNIQLEEIQKALAGTDYKVKIN
ncbi:MAG: heavy metal-associated domain-containing protein [bacterium]|nr:heavy metal-associated domain-containing protein [bacterium]